MLSTPVSLAGDNISDDSPPQYDVENMVPRRFVPIRNSNTNEQGPTPDGELFANSYVKLSHGITAYYIIEPADVDELESDPLEVPVVLCLHGLTNSSYMYRDLAEHLSVNTKSRVLAFDFYGRGRSPWTGVKCTMETFVCQATELLERKTLFNKTAFTSFVQA